MRKLFLISGKAESGKDKFTDIACSACFSLLVASNISPLRFAFADAVKQTAKECFEWDGVKDTKGRELLQLIGDGGRKYDELIWVKKMVRRLDSALQWIEKSDTNFIAFLTDVRYPNEVVYSKLWAQMNDVECYSIRIIRPGHENKLTPEQRLNSSETALDNFKDFDYFLWNNSTLTDFEIKTEELILELLNRRA